METRAQIFVRGIVQGVGFRPYVFLRAKHWALKGSVLNQAAGVLIDVQGDRQAIEEFLHDLSSKPPPLSSVDSISCTVGLPLGGFTDFRIVASSSEGEKFQPVSADLATCDLCLAEMRDPTNRRYGYPFISCTQCGPRFTIIEDVPYDRARTSMRDFGMCSTCRAEYRDPGNRRFHAEANACASCGPRLSLADASGRARLADSAGEVIAQAADLLNAGKIIAIKGLGGFHLACDARNRYAVERLRERKSREGKPFALMARSLEMIHRCCRVSAAEERLLGSRRRPIVLLSRREDAPISRAVAPGLNTLGFMLPYTPLHHMIFDQLDAPLVVTSGNAGAAPIAYRNRDAIAGLGTLADFFLLHDRRICVRADDSVARVERSHPVLLRRSRGYAPEPLKMRFEFARDLIACGAHLKNTFCLGKKRFAFLSHHIGDLENVETVTAFEEAVEHLMRLLQIRPEIVAYDLHPDYCSTRYALAREDATRIGVQHHHAHIASCMAEHGLEGRVIGVAFDGTGYGSDGALWGGEFLVADLLDYERRAHLRYIPLAGGETAIRQPWRSALAYLRDALGDDAAAVDLPGWGRERKKIELVRAMIQRGVSTAPTSSCGRLFDAVASILGVRHAIDYEGQAAIELESIARQDVHERYPFDIQEGSVSEVDLRAMIRAIVSDAIRCQAAGEISARFHNTIATVIVEVCRRLRNAGALSRVCLSGGVFQNCFLLSRALESLEREGFEVYYQRRVPTNDGGIALGQAAVANERFRRGHADVFGNSR